MKIDIDRLTEEELVDLGPEGGDGGGRVVFQGTPEAAESGSSHTCLALRQFLGSRRASI